MINNTTVKCIVYLQMYRFRSIYYSRTLSNAPLLETESTRLYYITFTIANPHSFTTVFSASSATAFIPSELGWLGQQANNRTINKHVSACYGRRQNHHTLPRLLLLRRQS